MKIAEQKQFVRDLIKTVEVSIIDNVYDMPSDWDGIELRQYIADKFQEQTYEMKGARSRNYKNDITTSTL